MTPRQRWLAVLQRKRVDRLPCDIWATPEIFSRLRTALNCENDWQVIDKLQIDAPYTLDPLYIGPPLPIDCDIWMVRQAKIEYGTGSYNEATGHPLNSATTIADIDRHPWPDADCFDYKGIAGLLEGHEHRPIRTGWVEPFYFYSRMRGLEQAMMDLIVAPDMVECAFDHIFDFAYRRLQRIIEQLGSVDIVLPSEDLGSQQGPLFSLNCFRKFHKPRFKKYIELAKQAHAYVFFHTDGACSEFLDDLIEIGIDILNPIQYRCPGMKRDVLKTKYGSKLVFHGGVENQQVLPFGTVEDVQNEVRDCFTSLGKGSGYICAPCHAIQPVTPVENIFALYDTIKEIASDSRYTQTSSPKV